MSDPLEQFATRPKPPEVSTGPRLRVADWLRDRGVEFREHQAGGTVKYYLDCPFNSQHNGTDSYITQFDSGATYWKCSHNSCAGYSWPDARDAIGAPGAEHWDGRTARGWDDRHTTDTYLDLVENLRVASGLPAEPTIEDDDSADDWGQAAGDFPVELLDVPGFVGQFAEWVNSWAPVPQPVLAMAGGIAAAAGLLGSKVDYMGCRTNLYLLAMGPSGCGKDAARRAIKNLFAAAGAGQLVGAEGWRSGAGLISQLAAHPVRVFLVDEVGKLLEAIRGAGSKSPWLQDIATQLTILWSSASTTYEPSAYADAKRAVTLVHPCATVYGTTVPDDLWGNLSESTLRDGFLARQMLLEVPRGEVNVSPVGSETDPPQVLIDYTRQWWSYQQTEVAAGMGSPDRLLGTPEAAQALMEYRMAIRGRHDQESEKEAAVWARAAEKAVKLAMIRACSRGAPEAVRIELADVEWARRLVNWSTRLLLHGAGRNLVQTDWHRWKLRAVEVIRERGKLRFGRPTITMRDLKRAIRGLRGRDRTQLIEELEEDGTVEVTAIERPGRGGGRSFLVSLVQQ